MIVSTALLLESGGCQSIQPTQNPFFKDLLLKWHLHLKSRSCKSKSFFCDIVLYLTYPGRPSLWEILYGGWLSGDMWDIEQCHNKQCAFNNLLLKFRGHCKSFENRSCVGWNGGTQNFCVLRSLSLSFVSFCFLFSLPV